MLPKPTAIATGVTPIDHGTLPSEFFNAYDLLNAEELSWPIRLYKVRPANGAPPVHSDRGSAKNLMWRLRALNKSACRGFGFVVDMDAETVAVPDGWRIPADGALLDGLTIDYQGPMVASASQPSHRRIIEGIIREGIKKHFKDTPSAVLGDLWQDYGGFCQMPDHDEDANFFFCRRFDPTVKLFGGNRWILEVVIGTSTLDRCTFADYYQDGNAIRLADLLSIKRANRLDRANQPTSIRVWRNQSGEHQGKATVLELSDPDSIIGHGTLSPREQRIIGQRLVRCQQYGRGAVDVPPSELRLVLDTQITQSDHEETIINPAERLRLATAICEFIDGADVFGKRLQFARTPVDLTTFPGVLVKPPAIRLRDQERDYVRLDSPNIVSSESLRKRSRARVERIRSHGFLQSRPIKPLLAVPEQFGTHCAQRMKADLESIWRNQGIEYAFDCFFYKNADALMRHIEQQDFDATIVVLPERSSQWAQDNDTHEQIKRCLTIPSQCIHRDNTLPAAWAKMDAEEFRRNEPRLARRISQRYELCLGNLLVKHHWIPFAPDEPFHYNVHVGVDVGGRHNTTAMLCVGHGFSNPHGDIVYRPEEIPVNVQKAEPIPTESLLAGLLASFEVMHGDLSAAGAPVDFNRALFFRDGHFFGNGDRWNETDALKRLHAEFINRGWIRRDSVWTAVEVLKSAEGWRLFRNGKNGVENPLVGRCVFPFGDENVGLVCTTGQPYLPQGTACPLKIKIIDIAGKANRFEVVRDLVWEADMCFSKPDMGMRLPWILHVADEGALQVSRQYQITGIPV